MEVAATRKQRCITAASDHDTCLADNTSRVGADEHAVVESCAALQHASKLVLLSSLRAGERIDRVGWRARVGRSNQSHLQSIAGGDARELLERYATFADVVQRHAALEHPLVVPAAE